MLPDVIQLGPLSLNASALTLIVGALIAAQVTAWSVRRSGAEIRAPEDLVFYLMVGAVIGAKLLYVLRAPADLLANPRSLLIIPQGPLVGLGALAGAALAGVWTLRRRPDRLALMDRAAAPLLLGLAVAALGGRSPGAWAQAPALALAAAAAGLLGRMPHPPGRRAVHATLLACLAVAVADLVRPASAALFAGISLTQLLAALVATAAWAFTIRTGGDQP